MTDQDQESGLITAAKALGIVAVSAIVTFTALGSGLFELGHSGIKNAVAAQLKDPDSAQFRSITGSGDTYCGEVNARNSFGAYTGYRPFVVQGRVVLLEPTMLPSASVSEQADYYGELARFSRLQRACRD